MTFFVFQLKFTNILLANINNNVNELEFETIMNIDSS